MEQLPKSRVVRRQFSACYIARRWELLSLSVNRKSSVVFLLVLLYEQMLACWFSGSFADDLLPRFTNSFIFLFGIWSVISLAGCCLVCWVLVLFSSTLTFCCLTLPFFPYAPLFTLPDCLSYLLYFTYLSLSVLVYAYLFYLFLTILISPCIN